MLSVVALPFRTRVQGCKTNFGITTADASPHGFLVASWNLPLSCDDKDEDRLKLIKRYACNTGDTATVWSFNATQTISTSDFTSTTYAISPGSSLCGLSQGKNPNNIVLASNNPHMLYIYGPSATSNFTQPLSYEQGRCPIFDAYGDYVVYYDTNSPGVVLQIRSEGPSPPPVPITLPPNCTAPMSIAMSEFVLAIGCTSGQIVTYYWNGTNGTFDDLFQTYVSNFESVVVDVYQKTIVAGFTSSGSGKSPVYYISSFPIPGIIPTTTSTTTTSTSASPSSSSVSLSSSIGSNAASSATTSTSTTTSTPVVCYFSCLCSSNLASFADSTDCTQGTWRINNNISNTDETIVIASTDQIVINGAFSQSGPGSLVVFISSNNKAQQQANVISSGEATLGGTLTVNITEGFKGQMNVTIIQASSISGRFENVNITSDGPKCQKYFAVPIYETTAMLMQIQHKDECSKSDRKVIIIAAVCSGAGLIMIVVVAVILLIQLKNRGKLVRLFHSPKGHSKHELLVQD